MKSLIKEPMYSVHTTYGKDENGELVTEVIFFNEKEPDKDVPAFFKAGLANEVNVAMMSDTFEAIQ